MQRRNIYRNDQSALSVSAATAQLHSRPMKHHVVSVAGGGSHGCPAVETKLCDFSFIYIAYNFIDWWTQEEICCPILLRYV